MITMVMIMIMIIMIIVTWGLPSLCFFFCSCSTSPRGLWQSPRLSGYHDHDHCCHNSMITFEDILPASSRSSHHRIFCQNHLLCHFVPFLPRSRVLDSQGEAMQERLARVLCCCSIYSCAKHVLCIYSCASPYFVVGISQNKSKMKSAPGCLMCLQRDSQTPVNNNLKMRRDPKMSKIRGRNSDKQIT